MEQGRTEPDLESMTRLAELLQVTIEDLVYGKRPSKENLKNGWRKRLIVALIWAAISIIWFVLCQKYAHWLSRNAIEADIIGLFVWYYLFKPFRYILLTITVLSFVRININLHISRKWLRVVLLAAGLAFVVVFVITMYASWFGEGYHELRRQIFMFFNRITVLELEIIYALPTICIYLGIVRSLKMTK